jgi:hypothetical protein
MGLTDDPLPRSQPRLVKYMPVIVWIMMLPINCTVSMFNGAFTPTGSSGDHRGINFHAKIMLLIMPKLPDTRCSNEVLNMTLWTLRWNPGVRTI